MRFQARIISRKNRGMANNTGFIYLSLCFLALTVITVSKPLAACQTEHYSWRYRNQCYEVVFEEKNWYDARNYCARRGGDLAELRSPEVQRSVVQHLQKNHHGRHGFWIGTNDRDREGHWNWLHNPRPMSYHNWHPEQGPFGPGFLFGYIEDCGMIRTDDGYRWHDGPCNGGPAFHYSFICQYDIYPRAPNRPSTTLNVHPAASLIRGSTTNNPSTSTPTTEKQTTSTPLTTGRETYQHFSKTQNYQTPFTNRQTRTSMTPMSNWPLTQTYNWLTDTTHQRRTTRYKFQSKQHHNQGGTTYTNNLETTTLPGIVIFGK